MKFIIVIGTIAALIFLNFIISESYVWVRKRLNKPKFGAELLTRLLRKGDYVSIDGSIYQFSHIADFGETLDALSFPDYTNQTLGGELAFEKKYGFGYIFLRPSALAKCDFIFGKYGLKWARNKLIAKNAEELIDKYRFE